MLSLRQSLTKIGKQPPIRIPSELPVPSKSLRETLNVWNPFQYGITIVTGTLKGAGTDANVYITLFGDSGESNEISLPNAGKYFEGGKTDYFEMVAPDVGELRHIRIRQDNSGDSPGWFLSKIVIMSLMKQQEWIFFCNRWLAKDEEDGKIERTLYPTTKCTEYSIAVVTGAAQDAGTDANVFITLIGEHGDSGEFLLDDGINNFGTGYTDYFAIYARDLGELNSVRIRHDNTGGGIGGEPPGWFLSKIVVKNLTTLKEWTFPCDRWLAKDEDDGKIDRMLLCSGGG